MSAEPGRSDAAADRLAKRLTALPGVERADLSAFPNRLSVHCDIDGMRRLTEELVRDVVREETGAEPAVRIELARTTAKSNRARFESVEVSTPQPGRIRARVVLEWQRKRFEAEAEEEGSLAGEIRACAIATVRAVEKVADGKVSFTLIGAKEVHVFDHDLVAVLLQSAELPEYRLIGTSIIAEDRRRSAALAALSATNRAVGNYIE